MQARARVFKGAHFAAFARCKEALNRLNLLGTED